MNWSYVAGFFDGEGSIVRNGSGFRLSIGQTNLEVLERIQRFSGVGNIAHPALRRSHWKDNWVYYVSRQPYVQRFLRNALPYLVVKRDSAARAISELERIVPAQHKRAARAASRRREAVRLRERGWTFRAIGSRLGIDWGYARRLTLTKKPANLA